VNGLDWAVIIAAPAAVGVVWKGGASMFKWQRDLTLKTDMQNKLLFGDPKNPGDYPGIRKWQQDTTVTLHGGVAVAADAAVAAKAAAEAAARLDAGQLHIIGQVSELRTQVDDIEARQKDNTADITELAEAWRSNGGTSNLDKLNAVAQVLTSAPRDVE
jgi:hypothetical protein